MAIFSEKDSYIVDRLVQRLKDCTGFSRVYCLETANPQIAILKSSYDGICPNEAVSGSVIIVDKGENEGEQAAAFLELNRADNIIIELSDKSFEQSYLLSAESEYYFRLGGLYFDLDEAEPPEDFKVLAIIHVYNEGDVLEETVRYLLSQDVDVCVVDNWSKDNSYEIAMRLKEEYPDRLLLERFPKDGDNNCFDWYHQLERTEQLAEETKYNWYIHYDADEQRVSPIPQYNLRQFIYHVDRTGFNVIENYVVIFRVTDEDSPSIFMKDCYFEFGHRVESFEQDKTWKGGKAVDLKYFGGHTLIMEDKKVFPLKILDRHYPFRTYLQAQRKVFEDRKKRFTAFDRARGWHVHYDSVTEKKDMIFNKDDLIKWDENTYKNNYVRLFVTKL